MRYRTSTPFITGRRHPWRNTLLMCLAGSAMLAGSGWCQSPPADASTTAAVQDTTLRRTAVGSTYFAVGAAKLGIGAFNQLLAANGLPSQDTRTGTLGAGAYVSFGPLLVGLSGQAVISDERSNATYRTRTRGGVGLLDIGVALRARTGSTLALMGGVGGSQYGIEIHRRGDRSLDDVLADPGLGSDIKGRTYLFHASALADVALGARGPRLGLRGGYLVRLGRSTWSAANESVRGGPDAGFSGAYLHLSLGLGVNRRRDAAVSGLGTLLPRL